MVRAPCCEKMGLKKGPWTTEEDQILVSYIQKHGHGNWRSLPKLAGLLRCGKSCRLRWINYLRPDIKRGNYTKDEEETIIKLHEMLGNRWSAIAAKLPGRTDNEIKNVWHTHLKKRVLKQKQDSRPHQYATESESESTNSIHQILPGLIDIKGYAPTSPQPSSSEQSSFSTDISAATAQTNNSSMVSGSWESMDSSEIVPVIGENFWPEAELVEDSSLPSSFLDELHFQSPYTDVFDSTSIVADDGMGFWYDIFVKTGGMRELL